MGYVTLTVLVFVFAVAYLSRSSGTSITFVDTTLEFNIWDALIVDNVDVSFGEKCRGILIENFNIWIILYTFATILLYVKPQRNLFAPFKLNKRFPPLKLMTLELCRSGGSVLIGSAWEMLIVHLVRSKTVPMVHWSALELVDGSRTNISLAFIVAAAVGMYIWGDFHFYWIHRMLHIPILYKNIHSIHHESFNPTPWSGLSFHPVEGVIYFSSAPIAALFVPYYLSRLIFKSLLIFPLEGHAGM